MNENFFFFFSLGGEKNSHTPKWSLCSATRILFRSYGYVRYIARDMYLAVEDIHEVTRDKRRLCFNNIKHPTRDKHSVFVVEFVI